MFGIKGYSGIGEICIGLREELVLVALGIVALRRKGHVEIEVRLSPHRVGIIQNPQMLGPSLAICNDRGALECQFRHVPATYDGRNQGPWTTHHCHKEK